MDLTNYKTHFDQHGFVILKDILNNHQANLVTTIGNELENFPEQKGKWMIYFESNDNKKRARLENFINYHPTLKSLLYEQIMPIVNNIINKDLLLFKDKMNWKRPLGKGFKSHQDQPAWTDFKPDIFYTVALFIDTSTKEKGCLEFVNNFNKKEIIPYNEEGNGGLKTDIEDSLEWNVEETTPRDILIFNSFVPHRSGDNKTNESRRILYFTFNSKEYGDLYDMYFKKKREEFPPDIERENKDINILGNKYNLANPIG